MSAQDYAGGEYAPREFLGAVARTQSYLNILYLLLSMPLGIVYFTFLVTGISLGLSLVIVWVGLPILMLLLAGVRIFARGERQLARWLLDAPIGVADTAGLDLRHPWNAFKALVGDGETWAGMFFLFLKFPLGIVSFVFTVVLLAVSVSLMLVPLAFQYVPINVGSYPITSADAALLCLGAGLILAVLTIYILNGLAAVWRSLAVGLLTPRRTASQSQAHTGPIIIP